MRFTIQIKTLGIAATLALLGSLLPAQSAKIHGRLTEDGSTLPGETLKLFRDGGLVKGAVTNSEGKYEFALLPEGNYMLEYSSNSLFYRFTATLSPNETEPMDLETSKAMVYNQQGERVYAINTTRIEEYAPGEKREIFSLDPTPVDVVTRREMENSSGGRGVQAAISMLGSDVYQKDAGDPLNIGGARDNGTAVYVDGAKVRGDFSVSNAMINQISLMNNGMPAEFGDATGGIIMISTYNPGMKGFVGRPLTRTEKQALRLKKKRGASEGVVPDGIFHS